MSKDDRELIEGAAKYVLDNSRNGTWRNTASEGQCAADDAKLMEAYRDIIGKAMTFLAATRLEALQAQPRMYPDNGLKEPIHEFRNLAVEAIKESFAALTASPPVVEQEAKRTELCYLIERMCPDKPDSNLGNQLGSQVEALADAILALTPVEGVGVIDWRRIEDAIFEGLDANISCTQSKVRDLAKLLTARVTALSTPVAQGDEVRAALKLAYVTGFNDGWQDGNGEGDAVNTVCRGDGLGDFMSGITGLALSTLTKGARDAG